ncbi:MAG: class I SAM-dependent methyltransferase [Acidilobus sp.]
MQQNLLDGLIVWAHRWHRGLQGQASDSLANEVVGSLNIAKGATVADLGSGPGRFTIPIAKLVGPEGRVIAVDVDSDALDEIVKAAKGSGLNNVEVIRADLTKGIPLPDSSIDVAFMANVLHGLIHSGAGELVVREVERVLKPGGFFVVVDFIKGSTPFGPPPWIRLSEEEVVDLVNSNSSLLKLEDELRPVGGSHYLVKFRKGSRVKR